MKILLFYNLKAGNEDFPLKICLIILKKCGAEVISQNTKEEGYLKVLNHPCDFIIIAGGDGTIGNIIKRVIEKPVPIAILPFGSANNFANSLHIDQAISTILYSWENKTFRKISLGTLNTGKEKIPFVESVGWGLFAELLMKKSKNIIKKITSDKIKWGLKKMIELLKDLEPSYYEIYLDDVNYSGNYYWVEILNTNRMGPQILLAPGASPEDNNLEVVLVIEKDKLEKFLSAGLEDEFPNIFNPLYTKTIKISSNESIHIDSESYKAKTILPKKGAIIEIDLHPNKIEIMNSGFE